MLEREANVPEVIHQREVALAREMAAFILPRAGSAQHPLTIHASLK